MKIEINNHNPNVVCWKTNIIDNKVDVIVNEGYVALLYSGIEFKEVLKPSKKSQKVNYPNLSVYGLKTISFNNRPFGFGKKGNFNSGYGVYDVKISTLGYFINKFSISSCDTITFDDFDKIIGSYISVPLNEVIGDTNIQDKEDIIKSFSKKINRYGLELLDMRFNELKKESNDGII